jgi:hypothetical protein
MEFDSTFAAINAFGRVDYAPHNKGVTPIFFVEAVQDHAASERQGRAIYIDKERVRIHIVGDSTAATHPVDEGIKRRFAEQYEAWKRKETGSHIKGTPLKKWPMSTPSMMRELESWNIFSVEDLGAVSDGNVQNITDGRALRDKATAWLKSAVDGAAVMKLASENHRLRDELEELRKAVQNAGISVEKSPKAAREILHRPPLAKAKKPKKNARKSAWTQERRKAASAAVKARGGIGAPRVAIDGDSVVPCGVEA